MKTLPFKLLIFTFCVFLFSFGVQNISMEFKGDENFYFKSAEEMLVSGDVITPRYMGKERFQKPPLFYWLVILSFKGFGLNWFAARLPSVILGALCALLIFAISELLFEDKKIALFAALFSATTPLFYRYARLALPDMTLIFFITLALYCFARIYRNREERFTAAIFFAAMAFAVLTKGPVGLIIPLLIVGIFCLAKKEKSPFSPKNIFIGIFIFLLIAVPWFYLMHKMHGNAYFSHAWNREILQRIGGGYEGFLVMRYVKGLSFYTGVLVTRFLPYSLLLPAAFIGTARLKLGGRERDARLFLVLWITTVFFFFTFLGEKRAHYLLALSPAVSMLIAANFKNAIKHSVAPLAVVLSLALIYTATCISTPLGLFKNKMERAASIIKSEFKTGDSVGIGSHGIIPEELQAYFEIPVKNVKVRYKRDGTPDLKTTAPLLQFLRSDKKVFCVIKRRDYNSCVPPSIRKDLYVLGGYYVWKRRIRFDKGLKDSLSDAGSNSLKDIFQNEIYVVSNRK